MKADPVLAHHWAEQAGRIDRKAFEARARLRVPVWVGNAVLVLGMLPGAAAVVVALTTDSETTAGLALVFAALDWSVSFHVPAHWLVGRLVGMRFLAYYVRDLIPPVPGLKIDYATYLRVAPEARAWMHASGAIASKIGPFLALGVLAGERGSGVGRVGDPRVRPADHRDRRLHLDAQERLEAVPPRDAHRPGPGREPLTAASAILADEALRRPGSSGDRAERPPHRGGDPNGPDPGNAGEGRRGRRWIHVRSACTC